jgi:hypothetical protein
VCGKRSLKRGVSRFFFVWRVMEIMYNTKNLNAKRGRRTIHG